MYLCSLISLHPIFKIYSLYFHRLPVQKSVWLFLTIFEFNTDISTCIFQGESCCFEIFKVVYYDVATQGLQKQRFTMRLDWFQNVEERISILSTSQRMWNQWLLVQLGPRSSTEDRSVRPALVCTFLSQCGPKSNRKC